MNLRLDRKIAFDRPATTQDAKFGADTQTWVPYVEVFAERVDVLPSRSESVRQGLAVAENPTRYRLRWRPDIDSSMRVREGDRVMQILSGPAELGGRRAYMEIVCANYSTQGGAA